ncbi:pilus assembly protein [Oerskovia flava]|uniref:pilus assembly protein n=1 Tax=Oerskovia flava TaxID=2986422 RepID=UPI0022407C73|nr:pilus assembly protein [Oerskovia sp. JB1-3-2]
MNAVRRATDRLRSVVAAGRARLVADRTRTEGATATGDRGNAVVEFLGVALILLIPLMYLVVLLGRIQAATFAVEGASREAGRAFVTAETSAEGTARAGTAVALALEDQGFDSADGSSALSLACSLDPCLEPGGEVAVQVSYAVDLPWVPAFVQGAVPLAIPLEATYVASVDQYAARRP